MPMTGVVITNKRIWCKLAPDSFWTGLIGIFMKYIIVSFEISQIRNFQIGEHDTCFGTAYIGHQFIVNEKKLGLLRMGSGIFYDEDMLKTINKLSLHLYEIKIFDRPPKEYLWQ